MLTTAHDATTTQVTRRGGRRVRGQPAAAPDVQQLAKPNSIIQYNSCMGAVDKQDQVYISTSLFF